MDDTRTLLDGAEMVLVPAGEFVFGISDREIQGIYRARSDDTLQKLRNDYKELPRETITLPDFYIDKFPTTNSLFSRFLKETGYKKKPKFMNSSIWGDPNQPVVGIDWDDAIAYANWTGKRLPNEREWEKAARGSDGRLFPWGNELDETYCNCFESGLDCTSAVGSFPVSVSPCGAYDLAGNVWEMTIDMWDEHSYAMRGGSYLTYQRFCRASARWAADPEELTAGASWLGFRCVYVP